MTYHYAARGGPSHGYRRHAYKCGEDRTCSFEDMIADKLTQTDRHAHRNTSLPYRRRNNHQATGNTNVQTVSCFVLTWPPSCGAAAENCERSRRSRRRIFRGKSSTISCTVRLEWRALNSAAASSSLGEFIATAARSSVRRATLMRSRWHGDRLASA